MSELGRPSQKQQSSRKGKKAWRKNIDIDDIEKAIEAKREEIRQLGVEADQIPSDELFQIDVAGDKELLQKKKIKDVKPLKADEILANKSKVPGLTHPKKVKEAKNKKFQGVSGKEVHSLMKIAGRVQGVTSTQGLIERHGLSTAAVDRDAWEEPEEDDNMPEILKTKSVTSYTSAKHVPKTLKEDPISVKEITPIPHAGKSYNPSLDSWKTLINTEFYKEKSIEDKKVELEKHQERIQELINTVDDIEEKSDSESDVENKEGSSSEEEEEDPSANRLSVNKPVKNKKKTKAQRNKKKKHEERTKLEQELKELRKQITELQKIKDIESEVNKKENRTEQKKSKEKKRKSLKLGTKYHVMDDTLEVKLSDELNDSLRKLKPEGNLLYDQMRVLQSKGKIESRLPVKKKRRYTPKVTEKWTYKDFK